MGCGSSLTLPEEHRTQKICASKAEESFQVVVLLCQVILSKQPVAKNIPLEIEKMGVQKRNHNKYLVSSENLENLFNCKTRLVCRSSICIVVP